MSGLVILYDMWLPAPRGDALSAALNAVRPSATLWAAPMEPGPGAPLEPAPDAEAEGTDNDTGTGLGLRLQVDAPGVAAGTGASGGAKRSKPVVAPPPPHLPGRPSVGSYTAMLVDSALPSHAPVSDAGGSTYPPLPAAAPATSYLGAPGVSSLQVESTRPQATAFMLAAAHRLEALAQTGSEESPPLE
jgi:hypothetical protein